MMIGYSLVSKRQYLEAFANFRLSTPPSRHLFCSLSPNAMAYFLCDQDKLSGFCLEDGGGYLSGVFSHGGNQRMQNMIEVAAGVAKSLGFKWLSLNCYGPVQDLYEKQGFEHDHTMPFSPMDAPCGWTPEMGNPDQVAMLLHLP